MKSCKFLAALFALCAFAGCSSDETEVTPVGPETSKESVFMSVQVALPTAKGVRSATGNTTEEVGKDVENNVSTVLLVLATPQNEYVTSSLVGGLSTQSGQSTLNVPKAKISRTEIQKFYDADGKAKNSGKLNVYVFCNPTQHLLNALAENTENWSDAVCQVEQGKGGTPKNVSIWADNSFLMSNASVAVRTLPLNLNTLIAQYSEEKPFNLCGANEGGDVDNGITNGGGPIRVERSIARFDFRDGSGKDNTYDIGATAGEKAGALQVKLFRMALVNMSNEFHYLRRVSENGLPENADLCGTETDANYVVDTDAAFKRTADLTSAADLKSLRNHFNYPLFSEQGTIDENTRGQWDSHKIEDVLNNGADNPDWTAHEGDYRIWRYVVENTIPQEDRRQKTGLTTGIVFKGRLLVSDDLKETHEKLYQAVRLEYSGADVAEGAYIPTVNGNSCPILYVFQDRIYVGWNDEVMKAAEQAGDGAPLHEAVFHSDSKPIEAYTTLVNTAKNSPEDTAAIEKALLAFRTAAKEAGFTLYQASDDTDFGVGYYFYYYAWNRHNDNGDKSMMGPMEFGVVRNNVYKLAVTKIRRLGHPRISGNDPDPVDPDDPDEDGDVYFDLSVEVVPWTVRVNDFEF